MKRFFKMSFAFLSIFAMTACGGPTSSSSSSAPHVHSFGDYVVTDSTHTRVCTTCGYEETGTHSGGTRTCSIQATCEVCGSKYGNPAPHNYGSWIKVDETHHKHICQDCHTEEVGDHTYNKEVASPEHLKSQGSCTVPSLYYKSCVCGANSPTETFEQDNGHKYVEDITAEGALLHEASCTEPALYYKSCQDCHELSTTETFEYGNPLGHDYVYHAACTTKTYAGGNIEYYSCSRCTDLFIKVGEEYLPAEEGDIFDTQRSDPTFVSSEADPYIIADAHDLMTLRDDVNGDYTGANAKSYEGAFFKLANDIDFTGIEFGNPIGYGDNLPFSGTFDGNGKTISNLTISNEKDSVGLISRLTKGTLKNLSFENLRVTAGGTQRAGLVARMEDAVVDNVHILSGSIKAKKQIGGIAGCIAKGINSITNCSNKAEIISLRLETDTGGDEIGGIVGSVISNFAATAIIKNCTNEGPVTSSHAMSTYLGGIVGRTYPTTTITVEGCTNKAAITAVRYAGGIIGCTACATGVIKSCVNEGLISFSGTEGSGGITGGFGSNLAKEGSMTGILTIESCTNKGDVVSETTGNGLAGGIIGTTVENIDGLELNLIKCYNYGNVSANHVATYGYVGGIIGLFRMAKAGLISECYNLGNVTSTGILSGGIAGVARDNVKIEKCYVYNKATLQFVGGAVPTTRTKDTISIGIIVGELQNNSKPEKGGVRATIDDLSCLCDIQCAVAHKEEVLPARQATPEVPGLTAGVKCSVCGITIVAQQEVPYVACTHETVNHVNKVEESCTEAGKQEYWVCANEYCKACFSDADKNTYIGTESTIGEWGVIQPHHFCDNWQPNADGLTHDCECSKCHETIKENHEWPNTWTTTKEPTHIEEGSKERVCPTCGAKQTEVIAKTTTHTYSLEVANEKYLASAATCEESAKYYKSCECGDFGTATFASGDPLGHAYNAWTKLNDEQHIHTCTREGCDHYETANHNFGEVHESEPGSKIFVKECSDCGAVVVDHDDNCKHTSISYVEKVNATCLTNGCEAHYKCDNPECGKLFSDSAGKVEVTAASLVISATGVHDLVKHDAVAASFASGNVEYYTCKNIDDEGEFVDTNKYIKVGDEYVVATDEEIFFNQRDDETFISSASNPYTIANADDLYAFRNFVNEGKVVDSATVQKNDTTNMFFKLTADIVLEGNFGTPIGKSIPFSFRGTFDGDGHTIKDLTVTTADSAGLFANVTGTATKKAVIKNVKVENVTATAITSQRACGICVRLENGIIDNCEVVSGTISGPKELGGICCLTHGTACEITNCINRANIVATGITVGGILGFQNSGTCKYENNVNYGNVSGTCNLGGILGTVKGGNATIKTCVNRGNVTNTGASSFGLAGGIFGDSAAGIAVTAKDCVNYGDIKATKVTSMSYVGGIAGLIRGTVTENAYVLEGNKNFGNISGASIKYIGGIVGGTRGAGTLVKNNFTCSTCVIKSCTAEGEDLEILDMTKKASLFGPNAGMGIIIGSLEGGKTQGENCVCDATGEHLHNEVTMTNVPSTCEEAGHTGGKQCSICEVITEQPTVLPLEDHTYGDWQKTETTHTRTCSVCSETAEGHVETGTHVWDGGVPALGGTTYTCTVCGYEKFIPTACDHLNKTHETATDSTCTEQGHIEYWYCSDCESYFSDEDCKTQISQAETLKELAAHAMHKHDAVSSSFATGNVEYYTCDNEGDDNKYLKDGDKYVVATDDQIFTYQKDDASFVSSEANPYLISNVNDLKAFRDWVNAGTDAQEHNTTGMFFKMTADIKLEDEFGTPIGKNDTYAFRGTFDGDGHTIEDLTISGADRIALFNSLLGTSDNIVVVKNLKIKNATVTGNSVRVSILCVRMENATLDNCEIIGGSATGTAECGILAALTAAGTNTIKDCTSSATLNVSGNKAGLVGFQAAGTGVYTNITNNGNITSTGGNDIAGIVGLLGGGTATFTNCSNKGNISSIKSYTAGIVGEVKGTTTVTGCTNTGAISGLGDGVGGIVGGTSVASNVTITNCENRGSVTNAGSNGTGGIMGSSVDATATCVIITGCSNYGNIVGKAFVGGISGLVRKTSSSTLVNMVSECTNYGNVEGSSNVGGICGEARSTVKDCEVLKTCTLKVGTGTAKEASSLNEVGGASATAGWLSGLMDPAKGGKTEGTNQLIDAPVEE